MHFKDRRDAGQQLCQLLKKYEGEEIVVYGLPRGGVVVAAEIAKCLNAPLDLILAHKIGHPYQPEYAIAAISESGHMVGSMAELSALKHSWLEAQKELQIEEIKRKREKYLRGREEIPVKGKVAILVDDGIATGLTMQVGIQELKGKHPKSIIVAVPVAPKSTAKLIKGMVDDLVGIVIDDEWFLGAVGAYYDDFNQTEDEEVIELLGTKTEE